MIRELRDKDHFLVGYAGTHGIANAMEFLIEAAEDMKDDPVSFVLVGKGPERDQLIQMAKQKGIENIHFLPVINKKAIPDFLGKMDCNYIGWRRSPLYQFGVSPNKLLDYLMSGKPVIHGIEAGNDLVEEARCGISMKPEDPKEIVQAVREMMKKSNAEREQMGKNGKEFVMKTHDYRVLSQRFIDVLSK